LKGVLETEGFQVSTADASLFVLKRNGRRAFLLVYVDDGLIAGDKDAWYHPVNRAAFQYQEAWVGSNPMATPSRPSRWSPMAASGSLPWTCLAC
jgi:hypothetical protein